MSVLIFFYSLFAKDFYVYDARTDPTLLFSA